MGLCAPPVPRCHPVPIPSRPPAAAVGQSPQMRFITRNLPSTFSLPQLELSSVTPPPKPHCGVPGPLLTPPLTPLSPYPPPRSFLSRDDIGIILINQCVAELIRHAVEAHTRSLPAVLEIPSKEHPYDAARDSVLRRARGMFTADDLR